MERTYQAADETDRQAITEFLKQEGQFLLPMVGLVEQAELALEELIEMMGDGPGDDRSSTGDERRRRRRSEAGRSSSR